jgi:hypothetical protein
MLQVFSTATMIAAGSVRLHTASSLLSLLAKSLSVTHGSFG